MAYAKPAKSAKPSPAKPAKPNLGPGADNMMSALAQGHAANSKRLDAHDSALDGHKAQLDGHHAQLAEHHDRLSALEKGSAAGSSGGPDNDNDGD